MPGKIRVSALAKELGLTSKEAIEKLTEMGEYVKTASSTVEAPVARKLRESMSGGGSGDSGNGRLPSILMGDSAMVLTAGSVTRSRPLRWAGVNR